MVSITDLAEYDDFEFKEGEYALVGHSTGIRFAMGDTVRVRVVSTNLGKRQIDYTILELPKQERAGGKARKQPGRAAPANKRAAPVDRARIVL
jgi:ribonuclease R